MVMHIWNAGKRLEGLILKLEVEVNMDECNDDMFEEACTFSSKKKEACT